MLKKIISLVLCCFFSSSLFAGAWTQSKGDWLSITSFGNYISNRFWDTHGVSSASPHYQKYELDQYLEYGFTDRFTLGADFSAIKTNPDQGNQTTGSNDNTVFARYRFWKNDYDVFSAQGFVNIFGSAANANDPPQNGTLSSGEGLYYGSSGLSKTRKIPWFFDVYSGVTQRYGKGDQAQIYFEGGYKTHHEKLWLFFQNFNTISLVNPINPNGTNYDQITISPSMIYWFKKSMAVQTGVTQDILGRNLGQGTTPFLALWVSFK